MGGDGIILRENEAVFPLGIYEQPRNQGEWDEWSEAGLNLLCCHDEEQLDEADRRGMMAWVPVPIVLAGPKGEDALAERVRSLRDHPAIAVWEAQDEAIWNACRLDDGIVTNRVWAQPAEMRDVIRHRLDALVAGLRRGSSIVRELDPGRKIWLNDAEKSDQEALARCLPYLDVVGYDYYPIPEDPRRGRQMHMLAGYTDRFRRTAPSREVWIVQQAFSWGCISRTSGKGNLIHDYNSNSWGPTNSRELEARPGVEEIRFMAWIAISHGATGLLWFGSAYEEENRSPLLNDLLAVIRELSEVQPFLTTGNVTRVRTITDGRHCPPVLGVSGVARRGPESTLLALINEDYTDHDVAVTGMDWVEPADLTPTVDPPDDLRSSSGGMLTRMRGHEVRLYLTK